MIPLHIPPLGQAAAPAVQKLASGNSATPAQGGDEKTRKAALEFESILVRQMLGPLEKSLTAGIGGGGASSPMVGSMVLESLSRSIAEGGGLGLAEVIERALSAAADSGSGKPVSDNPVPDKPSGGT